MDPYARYGDAEAAAPVAATLHETIRYAFDDTQRRACVATKGLRPEDVNHDPGHGAWSIGQLLKHQLFLMQMMIEFLKPGAAKAIERPDFGKEGNWNLDAFVTHREALTECFLEVLAEATPETLIAKHPDMPPPHWADWPVLMRVLRPLVDISSHTGQINYARRQLDNPIGQ